MGEPRKNRRDAMSSPTKTVGFGYVGRFNSGDLGWFLPNHLVGSINNEPINDGVTAYFSNEDGESFVLCRITVEQVFDSMGRPITRKVRREKA